MFFFSSRVFVYWRNVFFSLWVFVCQKCVCLYGRVFVWQMRFCLWEKCVSFILLSVCLWDNCVLSFRVFVWGRSVASLPTVSLGCPNQSHQLTTDIAPFALFFSSLFFLLVRSESSWIFFLGSGQFLLQSYMMEQVQWYESKVCFDSGPYKVIYCNLVFIYILIQNGLEFVA